MQEQFRKEIDAVYEAQLAYKKDLSQSAVKDRLVWLEALKKAILSHEESIKSALLKDFRKNPIETETTEILACILEINHVIKNLGSWMKEKKVSSSLLFASTSARLRYEPKGNALIITPWNYPFQLPIVHLVSSIAAGNTSILKLSEFSPHTNAVIKEIIQTVFAPKHVAVVEGEVEETTYLLSLKFDHIHFTGSPAVGKIIMTAAAKHLSDITLELGGKSPVFVDSDVDVRQTVRNIIWAKFVNMGQTCIAPDYLLVDKKLRNSIEQAFKEEMTHAFGEYPQQSSDLARIINEKQYNRLEGYIEELLHENVTWVYQGKNDSKELFIHPTIVADVNIRHKVMQEEIFGPILPIIYYNAVESAIDFVRNQEKPLALYVFSKDKQYINRVMNNTTAGGTSINDAMVHILHPNLPFGGVNNSGIGQSTGFYGFRSFSHERSVLKAHIMPMSKFFWYPYTDISRKFLSFFRRIIK